MATQKHGLRDTLCAGAFANVVECCVMYPLDSVKTRQHLRVAGRPVGFMAALKQLSGAGPRQLYRGLLPAVGMQAPRGMMKFACQTTVLGRVTSAGSRPTSWAAAASGFVAGGSEAGLITPFELVKVRLQAVQGLGTYHHTWHTVGQIMRQEGVPSLWGGLGVTLLRNGLWNAIYFGLIQAQKNLSSSSSSSSSPSSSASSSCSSPAVSGVKTFAMGTVAGALGSCASNPLDVCKSRIQLTPATHGLAHVWNTNLPSMLLRIAKQEGVAALYAGFLAKVLRLGPGGGVLLFAYEYGLQLAQRLPDS